MRFLHKFYSTNKTFFCLVDNIPLFCKTKTKYTKAIEYFNKYFYAVKNYTKIQTSNKFQNKIWQLWLQGKDNMPSIVQKCTQSVAKYHENDIIFLTEENLKDYIELPDYIWEKYKKGIIPYANFSDIIRLYLLAKYGGCWVDSTIYLTNKIPNDILNAKFFSFKTIASKAFKEIKTLKQFKLLSNYLNQVITIESPYFLEAKAGSEIINAVFNFFMEYWKYENSLFEYLMIDKAFILAVLNNEKCKEEFFNAPNYTMENTLLLQGALFDKFNNEEFEEIKSLTPIHKLTHKNLKRDVYKDSYLKYLLNN